VRGFADKAFTPRGQQHPRAFADEQRAQNGPKAGARPGDDRDLAVQPACHCAIVASALVSGGQILGSFEQHSN